MTLRRLAFVLVVVNAVGSAAAQTPAPQSQAQRPAPPTTYEQYAGDGLEEPATTRSWTWRRIFLKTSTAGVLIRTHGRWLTNSGT